MSLVSLVVVVVVVVFRRNRHDRRNLDSICNSHKCQRCCSVRTALLIHALTGHRLATVDKHDTYSANILLSTLCTQYLSAKHAIISKLNPNP